MNSKDVINKTDLIQDELAQMKREWNATERSKMLMEAAQKIINELKQEAAKQAANDQIMTQRKLERMRSAAAV